jgi:methyl-accepting chemotaxis protein
VRPIDDVAVRTSQPARKTTIEAACAGKTGEDCAAAVSDRKNMAGQTAKATEEIGANPFFSGRLHGV